MVAALKARQGFRKGLRIKGIQGHEGIYEMTWAPGGDRELSEPRQKRGEPGLWWYGLCGLAGGVGNAHQEGVQASMTEAELRAAIERHWAASQAGDEAAEQAVYADDAVLEYPQSGERFRGRDNIQGQRGHHPARREFVVRRVRGSGDLWISELVITYDGKPYDTVSIMEFRAGHVVRETQYFAEPFEAAAWRAQWADAGQQA
jgi:ketosteroid isomerase-like protein